MLRRLVVRYSALQLTVAATVFSIVVSMLLGAVLDLLLKGGVVPVDVVMSVLIPALVAPLVVFGFLRLLRELETAERQLRVLATVDTLTHTHNRRHFLELAERECARTRRYGKSLALLMVDVDRFKVVNDTLGHTAGDDTLRAIAEACRASVRRTDLLARYGGDEFVILLPETDAGSAAGLAERLRAGVEGMSGETRGGANGVTVSIGVAQFDPADMSLDQLMAEADRALYRAKSGGRNRVELAGN